MLNKIKKDLLQLANKKRAENLARFFKTGKGQYGEGDKFLGITVPEQRKIAKKYAQISLSKVINLLHSSYHEHRFTALLILVNKYQKGDEKEKKTIYNLYLKNIKHVNNWDLVDLSAPKIVGDFLLNNQSSKKILYEMSKSTRIWQRRIAVLATFMFINHQQYKDSLALAKILLKDEHDLIHKAVGWMLREIGKRDQEEEEKFLRKFYRQMPRTMLRYAIEKFDKRKKVIYMK